MGFENVSLGQTTSKLAAYKRNESPRVAHTALPSSSNASADSVTFSSGGHELLTVEQQKRKAHRLHEQGDQFVKQWKRHDEDRELGLGDYSGGHELLTVDQQKRKDKRIQEQNKDFVKQWQRHDEDRELGLGDYSGGHELLTVEQQKRKDKRIQEQNNEFVKQWQRRDEARELGLDVVG